MSTVKPFAIVAVLLAAIPAFGQTVAQPAETANSAVANILEAPPIYKAYFGESLVDDFYLKAGRQDILGKWHPNGSGPDKVYALANGRIEVHEVKAYRAWAGPEAMETELAGREMHQLSDAWLIEWEDRVLDNPLASGEVRAAAQKVREARQAGKLVRIYDEVNLGEGKWRSSEAVPVGGTRVRLDERMGPVNIERMGRKFADSKLKLEKLRLGETDSEAPCVGERPLGEVGGEMVATGKEATIFHGAPSIVRDGEAADAAAAVAINETAQASELLRFASKAAVPVALAVDAGLRVHRADEIEREFANSEITEQQREIGHATNAAGMVGGWAGAFVGAKVGGGIGAAAGTCIAPGPGTAIGGTTGVLAGGAAGYIGGEAAAEAGAEWAVRKVHASGTTIKAIGDAAWSTGSSAAQWTVGQVRCATQSGVEKACEAGQAVAHGASVACGETKAAVEWAGSGANKAWNSVFGH